MKNISTGSGYILFRDNQTNNEKYLGINKELVYYLFNGKNITFYRKDNDEPFKNPLFTIDIPFDLDGQTIDDTNYEEILASLFNTGGITGEYVKTINNLSGVVYLTANDLNAYTKNQVDVLISTITGNITNIDSTITSIENSITNIGNELVDIHNEITSIENDITDIETKVEDNTNAITNINQELANKLEADDILAGDNISIDKNGNEVTINSELEWGNITGDIDNQNDLTELIENITSTSIDKLVVTSLPSTDGQGNINITKTNLSSGVSSDSKLNLDIVSSTNNGLMTKESYTLLETLQSTVNNLQIAGGKYIGQSFDTKADLNNYVVPDTVNQGDFTFVQTDETKNNSTTQYAWSGTQWEFVIIINEELIGIATTTSLGVVKSLNTNGKVFVETDGTMSLVGYDSINSNITSIGNDLDDHVQDFNNPHQVTKSQIGLGNVDNTSDANKPISSATNTALNAKANTADVYTKTDIDNKLTVGGDLTGSIPNLQIAANTVGNTELQDGINHSKIAAAVTPYILGRNGTGTTETPIAMSVSQVQSMLGLPDDSNIKKTNEILAVAYVDTLPTSPVAGTIYFTPIV